VESYDSPASTTDLLPVRPRARPERHLARLLTNPTGVFVLPRKPVDACHVHCKCVGTTACDYPLSLDRGNDMAIRGNHPHSNADGYDAL
jgi:hypothetical protein